jgi:hypothetical protein
MKPNQNFKLSKTVKRMLCSITNKELRDTFRQNMIQAQLCSEVKPPVEKKSK